MSKTITVITKHSKDCSAVKLVSKGEWSTPWFFDGTTEWRDKNASTHGETNRYLVAKCNSTNDCPATALINEEMLFRIVDEHLEASA